MQSNALRTKLAAGSTVFGTYVAIPSPAVVETLALAGLDFVRMDPYHVAFNRETLENMVRAAYAHGITPWARIRNDPWEIATTLDTGVQIVTLPNIGTAEEARRAAAAARYPPHGDRENGRPLRFKAMDEAEYLRWAEREIMVACQIEGTQGLQNYREIVTVEGVAIVQTGRGDLANALGFPGETFHPRVLEIEAEIVEAARAAGKEVSLHVPLSERGFEHVQAWIARGVRIFTLDIDVNVMLRTYRDGLADVRRSAGLR